jgi:hypothetical protein
MRNLSVPSLQHLARNWNQSSVEVKKSLIRLYDNPPTFSYNPVHQLLHDRLVLNVPLEQVLHAVRTHVARASVRENYLELLPLIDSYFQQIRPTYVHTVAGRQYPVARNLMVPFAPPLVYGTGGEVCFPWFSLWKSNPLVGENLSLFVSVVKELVLQDPDLEASKFLILDLSAEKKERHRVLKIIDSRDVPILSSYRLREMLDVFSTGYFAAVREISNRPAIQELGDEAKSNKDHGQIDLFR